MCKPTSYDVVMRNRLCIFCDILAVGSDFDNMLIHFPFSQIKSISRAQAQTKYVYRWGRPVHAARHRSNIVERHNRVHFIMFIVAKYAVPLQDPLHPKASNVTRNAHAQTKRANVVHNETVFSVESWT